MSLNNNQFLAAADLRGLGHLAAEAAQLSGFRWSLKRHDAQRESSLVLSTGMAGSWCSLASAYAAQFDSGKAQSRGVPRQAIYAIAMS